MSRREVLIEALGATPRDLARMLRRVTPELALRRPDPAGWSIADLLAHLSFCEEHYLARLRRIVEQDAPHEPPFPSDPGGHPPELPLAELAANFAERRAATIAFLSGLAQADWGRRFVHATLGPSRLRDQVQAIIAHDNEHLTQLVHLKSEI
jgi:uncharacterized damage-inducible protein DinB